MIFAINRSVDGRDTKRYEQLLTSRKPGWVAFRTVIPTRLKVESPSNALPYVIDNDSQGGDSYLRRQHRAEP
jgi:hypothetical protein